MVGLAGDGGNGLRRVSRRRFFGVAGMAVAGTAGTLGFLRRDDDAKKEDVPLVDAAGPPDGARLGVHRVVWSVETDRRHGLHLRRRPDPDLTPQILEILDRYEVKATFFVVGYNAERRPDLLAEAVARGHEIGNHTWRQRRPDQAAFRGGPESLALGERAVYAALGSTPRYFRPPRGQLTGTAMRYAAENANDIVLWSVGRGVRGAGDPRSVTDHVLGEIHPGDIVLLHDGIGRETFRTNLDGPGPLRLRRDVEVRALPAIIEGTLERGLRPVTVSGLLDAARPAAI